ncbi:MAG: anthranilate synthase component I family protein [Sphingobacteriales bacterium]|nr:anthranilate synthase component I family protein [Sphingobacteriales bacterium]
MQPRRFVSFPITDFSRIKLQMLSWASRFNICVFLDNQHYQPPFHGFDNLLAAGVVDSVQASAGEALEELRGFMSRHHDWFFGHFGYGLVKETEPFETAGEMSRGNPVGFPDLHFFVPEVVIELKEDRINIGAVGQDAETIFRAIQAMPAEPLVEAGGGIEFQSNFSREEYIDTVEVLRQHILRGDCYEINFCQEFFKENADIDPISTWQSLSQASPNPFSAYYRLDEKYLLCASPERYLRRVGNKLISQPIKGTAPRIPGDARADEAAGVRLQTSAKDRSENVMVVDLVRNDLSKICLPGSVRVQELFGVYGFPQVYQMISTVEGELPPGIGLIEAVKASFPMGSMTGAPKRRVVELIDRYERSPRGLFSGSVGYVTPEGDFDFNVIIRSLFYNQARRYLSYQVGSGITFYSDAEQEYEECLIKAAGIKKALTGFF